MEINIYGQRELVERIINGENINSHVISIGNPSSYGRPNKEDTIIPEIFQNAYKDIIRLEFFDVILKKHLGNMRPKRIPLKRDVRKVIKYFKKNKDNISGFDIHCWRGISRSTAIALGLLFMIHNDEQIAVDELKRIRPESSPHPGIVKYYDDLMGCDLTSKNEQLMEIRNREMQEWFLNEISETEEVEALLEEIEEE